MIGLVPDISCEVSSEAVDDDFQFRVRYMGRFNSVGKRKEMRKDTGIDVVNASKIALDATLELTKDMQTDPNDVNKEPTIVTMEVQSTPQVDPDYL